MLIFIMNFLITSAELKKHDSFIFALLNDVKVKNTILGQVLKPKKHSLASTSWFQIFPLALYNIKRYNKL